ncbi:MAG: hypothetical protein CUN56_00195 [Phototrophicales bacterium]|nr:MAG: hypothetical protein CUN56_00195 [Phototrophicales bacterium]
MELKAPKVAFEPNEPLTALHVDQWWRRTQIVTQKAGELPGNLSHESHPQFLWVWVRTALGTFTIDGKPVTEDEIANLEYNPLALQGMLEVTEPYIEAIFSKKK